jgi:hypothetical protein
VLLLASLVAVLHGAAVLFMLVGGVLALHRPALVRLHAPCALAILGVNLAGADCPLTTLELALWARAGAPGYSGGFLGHYLFAPAGLDVHSPAVQLGIYLTALTPNALAYGLLAARTLRRRLRPAGR